MPRLPHAAIRLLRRSRMLTLGQKAVWQELAEFPETGCWLSAAALGDRVALSAPKVEQYRRLLQACGLARLGQRQPSEGRRGRPAQTWFATIPDHLIPTSRTPTDKDLAELGKAFDAYMRGHLTRAGYPLPGAAPDDRITDRLGSATTRLEPPARVGNSPILARSASRGEGGRGEGSPHSQTVGTTETPSLLHTPCTEPQRTREAASVPATVRPALARTLARETTAELDRAIESEAGGTRLAPRDLEDQLAGWEQRMRAAS